MKRLKILLLSICLLGLPIQAAAQPQNEVVTVTTRESAEKFIRDSLMRRDKKIQFETSDDLIGEGLWDLVKNQARRSDPYLYEILGNTAYVKTVVPHQQNKTYRYTMTMSYQETLEETQVVDRKVKAILNKLKVKKYKADKRAELISDWIVKNVAYDSTFRHYSAYDALTYHKATCMGYSLLTYKMFSAAGIPCRFVRGYTKSSVYHMWNAVKLKGKYYYVDTCWMDSTPNGKKSNNKYLLYGKTKCKKEMTVEQGYGIKNISKKGYRKHKTIYK